MALFHRRGDRAADGHEIGTFQEYNLRLDQARALEFDPAQRQHERVLRISLNGQQSRGPDGAVGGVLTPTGIGTVVEEGKTRLEVNGKPYLVETALHADFALIHAFLADYLGNLAYALTARNFNPVMAMAADTVIVTAENVVPVGLIAPDHVVTPAPLVDYLVTQS